MLTSLRKNHDRARSDVDAAVEDVEKTEARIAEIEQDLAKLRAMDPIIGPLELDAARQKARLALLNRIAELAPLASSTENGAHASALRELSTAYANLGN